MLFLNQTNTAYLFIFLFLFLICWWITGKFVKKWNSRATISLASSLILTYVMPWIFMLLFVGYMAANQYEFPQPFDPVEWKSENNRQTMVKDLVENNILIGKRTDEIRDLLGEKYGIDTLKAGEESWVYAAGQSGHGFGIKFFYLKISFENEIVEKVNLKEIID
jgi:hypothetical protein